ncbi:MAG: Na+/H+ antiporter subunit C [Candidatus Binatia bacterium]|nr:MAG: Na+/H+ antiporter subunit C [Candidatus Binatia bacterium]
MFEHFEYWATLALFLLGLYGVLAKRNLAKKLVGLGIVQSATILFFIVLGLREGGTIPIVPHHAGHEPLVYMSPLPQVLMLTAIVVAVSTSGVAFALLIRIYRTSGTLDEREVLERLP